MVEISSINTAAGASSSNLQESNPNSAADVRVSDLNDYGYTLYATGPSLAEETRTHVATARAAYWLNRKEQTLRMWACYENGPLRPVRINGRLAWSVAEIRRLLGQEAN